MLCIIIESKISFVIKNHGKVRALPRLKINDYNSNIFKGFNPMKYSRSRHIANKNRIKHDLNVAQSRARQRKRELERILRSLKNH